MVRCPPVDDVDLRATPDGVTLRVRAKPRASKSRVLGPRAGVLDVAVAAPPVDGEANQELLRTLARHFGLAPRQVELVTGSTGRSKLVRFSGIGIDEVRKRLASA